MPKSGRRRLMAESQPLALMDDVVEEILLRVPQDDPGALVRAAVTCKHWCRLVCGPGFRRRYLAVHGADPMLGFVFNCRNEDGARLARFVPAGSSRRGPPRAERVNWLALDARHGRVLLRSSFSDDHFDVAVWDPIRDELLELPATPWRLPHQPKHNFIEGEVRNNYKGAVLCAADGCDHLDCLGRPFLVVFVVVVAQSNMMCSYVYSSEANAWRGYCHQYLGRLLQSVRSTLVENALYFMVNKSPGILKYNLGTRDVSAISGPPTTNAHIALMAAEGGGLGCAALTWTHLCLWSAEIVGPDGDIGWILSRTIELTRPVPAGHSICGFDVSGFAGGGGIIHVETNQGYFTSNLKSGNFSEVRGVNGCLDIMVPYMCFYTPRVALLISLQSVGRNML